MLAPLPSFLPILRALRAPLTALAVLALVANLMLPAAVAAGTWPGAVGCWGTGAPSGDGGSDGAVHASRCCIAAAMAIFAPAVPAASVPSEFIGARWTTIPHTSGRRAARRRQSIRGPPLA
jgi:hypothetical protein